MRREWVLAANVILCSCRRGRPFDLLITQGSTARRTIDAAAHIIDKATFENPHRYPEGIEYVIVNGRLVLEKGKHLGAKPGRIVYGKGRRIS